MKREKETETDEMKRGKETERDEERERNRDR
jgi:hypothetical protein